MRKVAFIVLLILCALVVSYAELKLVNAIETVRIRGDGSVEGAGLVFENGVYSFAGDIYGQIVIEKDGIIVDGSGHVLHGQNEGGIFLEKRNAVVLRDIEVTDALYGVSLLNSNHNEITNSNCRILLVDSSNNTIHGNRGINLIFRGSSYNTIRDNNITDSLGNGFELWSNSDNNDILRNFFSGNLYAGMRFENSNHNSIYENNVVQNADGLTFYNSTNNTVHDNVIADGTNSGIFLRDSSQNKFFRNDIAGNNEQIICWYGTNIWDNGEVGNYWSNYNGTDTDGDGVGDEPYTILTFDFEGESYDTDNHPLMEPTIIPEFPPWTILTLLIAVLAGIGLLSCFKKRER